jgi:hypothetical protein
VGLFSERLELSYQLEDLVATLNFWEIQLVNALPEAGVTPEELERHRKLLREGVQLWGAALGEVEKAERYLQRLLKRLELRGRFGGHLPERVSTVFYSLRNSTRRVLLKHLRQFDYPRLLKELRWDLGSQRRNQGSMAKRFRVGPFSPHRGFGGFGLTLPCTDQPTLTSGKGFFTDPTFSVETLLPLPLLLLLLLYLLLFYPEGPVLRFYCPPGSGLRGSWERARQDWFLWRLNWSKRQHKKRTF